MIKKISRYSTWFVCIHKNCLAQPISRKHSLIFLRPDFANCQQFYNRAATRILMISSRTRIMSTAHILSGERNIMWCSVKSIFLMNIKCIYLQYLRCVVQYCLQLFIILIDGILSYLYTREICQNYEYEIKNKWKLHIMIRSSQHFD